MMLYPCAVLTTGQCPSLFSSSLPNVTGRCPGHGRLRGRMGILGGNGPLLPASRLQKLPLGLPKRRTGRCRP